MSGTPKRSTRRAYDDPRRMQWSNAWRRANGHERDIPERIEPREERAPAKPPPTKPAGELRRGDEVRHGTKFVSVAEAERTADGRIRVVVAGMQLLGWFAPDTPIQISPHTAARRTG